MSDLSLCIFSSVSRSSIFSVLSVMPRYNVIMHASPSILSVDDLPFSLQTVGRMVYSHKNGRGIVDKEFGMRKFFIHKHASYRIGFCKVKTKLLMLGLMMLVIYIADGCGVATTGGENITVEDAGGNEQTLQCMLAP